MNSKNKGSSFEREVCKTLSLWWTQDNNEQYDSVFWRTSNSGGRHTVRKKKGKETKNQAGDICAVDPIGNPLIDAITWEIKIGYNDCSISDFIDRGVKQPQYSFWFAKLHQEFTGKTWALVHKRNRRETIIAMPSDDLWKLKPINYSFMDRIEYQGDCQFFPCVSFVTLDEFLKKIKPKDVKKYLDS